MPRRLSDQDAAEALRRAGAEPLEDYPGGGQPWRARCTTCGREIRPRLASVRSGQGACRFCAGRGVDEQEAAAIMRAAGLEPLTAYPGAAATWRCRCVRCDNEVTPRYSNVRNGAGGCGYCSGRFVDAAAIEARMVQFGWQLLEPYPGSQRPWRVQCTRCGRETTKRWNDVQNGKPGCRYCAERAVTPTDAVASMRANGLEPLDPYPGSHAPWRCRCLTCDALVAPNLNTVRASGSSCRRCAWTRNGQAIRMNPDRAAERMVAAGFTPQEPYPGSHAKWWCTHDACGSRLQVSFHSVIDAGTGCPHCAVSGFKPALPAVVYVLTHPTLNCHKIGIAGLHSNRVASWKQRGWDVYRTRRFSVGADAYVVEQTVLRWLRQELHLPRHLPAGDGSTETVSADSIDLPTLWAQVDLCANSVLAASPASAERALGLKPGGSGHAS